MPTQQPQKTYLRSGYWIRQWGAYDFQWGHGPSHLGWTQTYKQAERMIESYIRPAA